MKKRLAKKNYIIFYLEASITALCQLMDVMGNDALKIQVSQYLPFLRVTPAQTQISLQSTFANLSKLQPASSHINTANRFNSNSYTNTSIQPSTQTRKHLKAVDIEQFSDFHRHSLLFCCRCVGV
jgi:hypothetical protein